jgi:hypothetical protein
MPCIRRKSFFGRQRLEYTPPDVPNWTRFGGIVWVGLFTWILILFMVWGISVGGFLPNNDGGLLYDLRHHRIRAIDIQRILGGSPVKEAGGGIVMDPSTDRIEIYTVGSPEQSRLMFTTLPSQPSDRRFVILIPDNEASYQDLVTAMDDPARDRSLQPTQVYIASTD